VRGGEEAKRCTEGDSQQEGGTMEAEERGSKEKMSGRWPVPYVPLVEKATVGSRLLEDKTQRVESGQPSDMPCRRGCQ